MKPIKRIIVVLTALALSMLIASCGQLPSEPPTAADIEVVDLPDACVTGVDDSESGQGYNDSRVADLIEFIDTLIYYANLLSSVALDEWDIETEGAYTVSWGPFVIEISWTTTDTDWIWTFTFNDGLSTHGVELVTTKVGPGWDLEISLDGGLFLHGTITPAGGEITIIQSDATYVVTWGPATDDPVTYDRRFGVHEFDDGLVAVAGLTIEYTEDGTAGQWSYTEAGDEVRSGAWPE